MQSAVSEVNMTVVTTTGGVVFGGCFTTQGELVFNNVLTSTGATLINRQQTLPLTGSISAVSSVTGWGGTTSAKVVITHKISKNFFSVSSMKANGAVIPNHLKSIAGSVTGISSLSNHITRQAGWGNITGSILAASEIDMFLMRDPRLSFRGVTLDGVHCNGIIDCKGRPVFTATVIP